MKSMDQVENKLEGLPAEKFADMACRVEHRSADGATGIEFRDCNIDYTGCPNRKCIKKLV